MKLDVSRKLYFFSLLYYVVESSNDVIHRSSIQTFQTLNQWNARIDSFFSSIFAVTPSQIERLYSRFTSLDRTDCGTLSRDDFLRIPELAINPLCDRIVHAFFADSTDDRVNFRKFMQVLAHFRPINKNSVNMLNSREEKLKCLYIHICICWPYFWIWAHKIYFNPSYPFLLNSCIPYVRFGWRRINFTWWTLEHSTHDGRSEYQPRSIDKHRRTHNNGSRPVRSGQNIIRWFL